MRAGMDIAATPPPRIRVDVPTAAERRLAAGLLVIGVAWLAYTRLYFYLHPRGLTAAPSAFMLLTKRPDPLCGLTRTFAWMWRGDLVNAVLVYPIGPAVFVGTLGTVGYLAWVTAAGRALRFRLPREVRRSAIVLAAVVLGLNWTAKLLWLGI